MTLFAWFSSLRVRLLLLIALAVLPGLVVTLSTAERWRQHETADARDDALRLARHAATLHARMIDDSKGALFALAQLAASFRGDDEQFGKLLNACLREHRSYESLAVVREDGSVTVQAGPSQSAWLAAERPYLKRAMDTGTFSVGDYEVDRKAARASLTFAYPIAVAQGQARRVLAATVGIAWLGELATKALLPRDTTVTVFDDRGTVYIRQPDPGDWVHPNAVPRAVLHALVAANGERTGEVTTSDGVSRQYAFEPLLSASQGGRLYVMVGIPTAVATAGADQILLRNLSALALAIIIAGAVGWVGSDLFILRQTRALVAATARVTAGDLGARTGIPRGPGELHQLAQAFDQMASALQARAAKILSQHQALNRQARRFRALIERSSDGIFLSDQRGVVRYVSPSTTRILGYAPGELLGGDGFNLVHADDRDFAYARFISMLARPGEHLTSTVRMRHQDGRWLWIEATLTNLLGEPSVEAVVTNYRDVTESRNAADSLMRAQEDLERRVEQRTAELSRSNESLHAEIAERRRTEDVLKKFSRAIEQTDDSVFITNRDGMIEYVNSAFERLTGYGQTDAVGATPRLFSSGQHDGAFYRTMWQTLLDGRVFRAVFLNKARDGRLYYEDQTVTPIQDESGRITHFVSTGRDITQRKRSEEALRRLNDRLEHEATRIAAALHDEASQFLTAAHITLADVSRELPPGARERLGSVRRNLDQVEEQLRRLAHELRPRILDDLGMVDALRFLAEGVSRRNGILVTVSASLQRRCPPAVETAVYRMVQEALTNLSKHAGASQGEVLLREDGNSLFCSVRDNGQGFDVSATLARRGDASLGLIGIQDRLEAVGGLFEIISTPGVGTELKARIPLES